jgi:hypothetical protein
MFLPSSFRIRWRRILILFCGLSDLLMLSTLQNESNHVIIVISRRSSVSHERFAAIRRPDIYPLSQFCDEIIPSSAAFSQTPSHNKTRNGIEVHMLSTESRIKDFYFPQKSQKSQLDITVPEMMTHGTEHLSTALTQHSMRRFV